MNDIETKKLINYDMKRILSRVEKEFGKIMVMMIEEFIERGTEENYNPQLNYIEHAIYDLQLVIPISDYELQEIIPAVIYDLKGYIDNKIYDYSDILDERLIRFAKELEYLFNPFINEEIKINELAKNDLKGLFNLPIICLHRINDSIDFWRNMYGKNGYFRMLEEMVVPIMHIGEFPYALDEKYLIK